jgi:hypothetical protein
VDRVQQPAPHPSRDRAAAHVERCELPRRHDAVLPCRHPSDQQIHVHNCRIETLPDDLRQNCITYMQL